jgi:hypothetical protein
MVAIGPTDVMTDAAVSVPATPASTTTSTTVVVVAASATIRHRHYPPASHSTVIAVISRPEIR